MSLQGCARTGNLRHASSTWQPATLLSAYFPRATCHSGSLGDGVIILIDLLDTQVGALAAFLHPISPITGWAASGCPDPPGHASTRPDRVLADKGLQGPRERELPARCGIACTIRKAVQVCPRKNKGRAPARLRPWPVRGAPCGRGHR
jgi:hypothetical protein